jgi:hypothetical protein
VLGPVKDKNILLEAANMPVELVSPMFARLYIQ